MVYLLPPSSLTLAGLPPSALSELGATYFVYRLFTLFLIAALAPLQRYNVPKMGPTNNLEGIRNLSKNQF